MQSTRYIQHTPTIRLTGLALEILLDLKFRFQKYIHYFTSLIQSAVNLHRVTRGLCPRTFCVPHVHDCDTIHGSLTAARYRRVCGKILHFAEIAGGGIFHGVCHFCQQTNLCRLHSLQLDCNSMCAWGNIFWGLPLISSIGTVLAKRFLALTPLQNVLLHNFSSHHNSPFP